jgi:hypothetical protein
VFSFFRKKPKPSSEEIETQEIMDALMDNYPAEVAARGFSISEKARRLGTKNSDYFGEIVGVADHISGQLLPFFVEFPKVKAVEIQSISACVVASVIQMGDLPEEEKAQIIDIYFDIFTGRVLSQEPRLNAETLRGEIEGLWRFIMPGVLKTATSENAEWIGDKYAPLFLLRDLDQLFDIERSEQSTQEAGLALREAVVYATHLVKSF